MTNMATFRNVFITFIVTGVVSGATWYWLMVKPRDLMIEEKNVKIAEVTEQLRAAYDQAVDRHAACDERIQSAVSAAERHFQDEMAAAGEKIETAERALADSDRKTLQIKAELENSRSLNDQLEKNLESCLETMVDHSVKKRILQHISHLNNRKAALTNDRHDTLSKINKRIPRVAELEERCKTADSKRSKQVCVPAARERMQLNLAIKESDEIQTQIRSIDEQVLLLQSKL